MTTGTMPCVTCRVGVVRPGHTTVTKRRDDVVMVIHQVPADLCDNCGEALFSSETVGALEAMFAAALDVGAKYAVRDFVAKVA